MKFLVERLSEWMCYDTVDRSKSGHETSRLEQFHSPSIDDGVYFIHSDITCSV